MVSILKVLIIAIFELLPESPFPTMFDNAMANADFLAYLNWFLPFDICSNMMLAWLNCILIYYAFVIIKKIVLDILVDKIISVGGSIIGAMGGIGGA